MKNLHLTFANVGYGEAMVLEVPDPSSAGGVFVLLLDGGGNEADEFAGSTTGRKPFLEHLAALGVDHVDAILCSHLHEDHISGLLPVVRKYLPKTVYSTFSPTFWKDAMRQLSDAAGETVSLQKFTRSLNDYRTICELVTQNGGSVKRLVLGDAPTFGADLRLSVLGPTAERAAALEADLGALYRTANGDVPDQKQLAKLDAGMNNFSLILRFAYGETRLLLPGDTNQKGFGGIDPNELCADLYKVGHHGQRDGADLALIEAIRPQAVVCCASSDRRYNSAEPQLLGMIAAHGASLYYSDCPPNPVGDPVPAHGLLRFAIGKDRTITAQYL